MRRGSVADGRELLREVLEAPLKFEPDGKTYRFSAPVATGRLIADTVLLHVPIKVASPGIGDWNQVSAFLQSMRAFRDSVGFAA